jgi:lysine 2,3-aminomutase
MAGLVPAIHDFSRLAQDVDARPKGRLRPSFDGLWPGMTKVLRLPSELVAAGLAPPEKLADLARVAERYAVAITPAIADLIEQSDPRDPIARQFVPDIAELTTTPDERADPIGDHAHAPLEGIVHRYPDRVLLKLVNVCAVYCRFCFRREMVGPGKKALSAQQLDAALTYIATHPEIWEVILTGGDPLVLSARRLGDVIRRIAAVDHVKIIRLHTRLPVVSPEKITPGLVRAMKTKDATTYVALHANHPRELTPAVRAAVARIVDAGIPMVSQSVLLRGVNDDAPTLEALMRAFVECRIKPYYLHHADLAPGTSHFRTSLREGQALMRALRGRVSGLAQPAYVLDIPGGFGKVPVGPQYIDMCGEAGATVEDINGLKHDYSANS